MAEADEIDEGAHNEDSLESYYGVKPDLEFLKTFGSRVCVKRSGDLLKHWGIPTKVESLYQVFPITEHEISPAISLEHQYSQSQWTRIFPKWKSHDSISSTNSYRIDS